MNPLLLTDGYKLDHRRQYPTGTSLVYSNWTPRKSRIENINEVVFFGLQYFIKKYIIEDFDRHFFQQPKEVQEYFHPEKEDLYELVYPVLQYPTKVTILNLEKTQNYAGKLQGIKGQYLIFEDGTVFNVRTYEGFVVDLEV
jgi:nicotinic acid phosphoribosyltransferase